MQRRQFVLGTLATLGASLATATPVTPRRRIALPGYPFTLGVASGYPAADTVVLWTRLAPLPLAPDGGMDPVTVPVEWELAADERFATIVRRGTAYAESAWAHSLHVEPRGLASGRDYWYRFRVGDYVSDVGHTWTADPAGQMRSRLRVAVASCQQYEQGYFAAYRQMVRDDTDLVLHVGDYIYESGALVSRLREHGAGECYTLEDYRVRYALYRSEAPLRAAHAHCPWLLVTDDHEVDNDYANDISEENDEPRLFLARRAAAYRAYYEHQPLPRRAVPFGPDMRMYATCAFGDLASLHLLDERQYRSAQACPRPGQSGGNRVYADACPALTEPARTMLGARQESWMEARLAASRARWNLLAQGVVVAYCDEDPGERRKVWTDGWNGYPAARERLLGSIARSGADNPLILGGDIHAFVASDIRTVVDDPRSALLTSELVTTSITSHGPPQGVIDAFYASNPDVKYADADHRGYLRLDLAASSLQADLVAMQTVATPDSAARVLTSYAIEAGRKGL